MKNVILIVIDALRADHLGCYGYKKNTSVFLDELSNKGTLFRNVYANGPGTTFSYPAILSSDFASTYDDQKFLSRKRTLISEVLQENGYITAAFHSNPYLSDFYGYNRGFDFFYDSFESGKDHFLVQKIKKNKKLYKFSKKIANMLPTALLRKILNLSKKSDVPYVIAEEINNMVIGWLKKNKQQPFFLWIHYMDVHEPYVPNQKSIARFGGMHINNKRIKELNESLIKNKNLDDKNLDELITLYDAEIFQLDKKIQELYYELEKMGLLQNSIVLITSDHGDEFKEHGQLSHNAKLYDELLHVPLIFLSDDISHSVNNKMVSLIDISPTILDYLDLPERKEFRGTSIFKNIGTDCIISECINVNTISVRTKKYKLIQKDKKYEFYDLLKDPKEQKNIFNTFENKDIIEKFKVIIEEHRTRGAK